MIRNIFKMVGLLAVIFSLHAKKLDFLEEDFEKFVDTVMPAKEPKEPFKAYYTSLSDSLQKSPEHKRSSTYRYLVRLAMTNLRATHADWYNAIEPYMTEEEKTHNAAFNEERIKITTFLIRYGAYEEFKTLDTTHQKAQVFAVKEKQPELPEKNWWQQTKLVVKEFATSAYNTVNGWFGAGRRSISVAA